MGSGCAVITLVLLLAACTSGSAADAPEGWTVHEADGYAFAHPDGWEVRTGEELDDAERDVEVYGPPGTEEFQPVISAGQSQVPDDLPMGQYESIFSLNADAQLPDREVVEATDVEVDGARAARRLEASFTVPLDGGDVEIRQVDLLVLAGDAAMNLRYSVRADDYDEQTAAAVLDSFRVRR